MFPTILQQMVFHTSTGYPSRIFRRGVQFAEILLTTPTLKTTPIIRGTQCSTYKGVFYIVADKRVAS